MAATAAWLALAAGTLYHPEFIHPLHGQALIDCDHGYASAMRAYFESFAKLDGLPAAGAPSLLTFDDPKAPISRFDARVGSEIYQGFIYVDPTLTPDEEEPWEDEGDAPDKVCSAVFVDSRATAEERRRLDEGFTEVVSRLYLDQKAKVALAPRVKPSAPPAEKRGRKARKAARN